MKRETRNLVITITPLLAGILFLTVLFSFSKLLLFDEGFDDPCAFIKTADPPAATPTLTPTPTPGCKYKVARHEEFRARMFWRVAATALLLSLVWNSIVSIFLIRRNGLGWLSKPIVWLIVGAAGSIPLSLILLGWKVFGAVANGLVNSIKEYSIQEYSKVVPKPLYIPISALNDASNILTSACIFLVIIACCSLIYFPEKSEKSIPGLVEKIEQSKLSLYSAAAFLACGVFEVHFLYNWPASFLENGDAIKPMAGGLTVSLGVLFSLLLVIVYLPVALIHRSWVSDLANHASIESQNKSKVFDRDEWLHTHGLQTSSLSVLPGIFALLAPTIAGIIGLKLPI